MKALFYFGLQLRCKMKQLWKLFYACSALGARCSLKHRFDRHQSAGETVQIACVSEDVTGAFLNGSTGFSLNSRFGSG